MGIFDRLSTLFKSNINDLISRAENPEKMLNQIILDMRDQLAKAKREVAAAIADERKLKQQMEEEGKQTRAWEQRAMLAVRENRDDLAKQALIRQQEHAEDLAPQLARLHGHAGQRCDVQPADARELGADVRQLVEREPELLDGLDVEQHGAVQPHGVAAHVQRAPRSGSQPGP